MKTVFFDVDTQLDFLYPAGALYVPGAEQIVPALTALTRFAASSNIPLLSTADAHTEDDAEFKVWKPHCVAGTTGQQKSSATLTGTRPLIISSNPDSLPEQALQSPQIIIEKQHTDCFTNPNLRPLLASLKADRFIVYGVVSEICVNFAALGLLTTGAQVEIVTDAVRALDSLAERAALAHFQSQGGRLITLAAIAV